MQHANPQNVRFCDLLAAFDSQIWRKPKKANVFADRLVYLGSVSALGLLFMTRKSHVLHYSHKFMYYRVIKKVNSLN